MPTSGSPAATAPVNQTPGEQGNGLPGGSPAAGFPTANGGTSGPNGTPPAAGFPAPDNSGNAQNPGANNGQPSSPGSDQPSAGGNNGPSDFRSPIGAVNAFLNALTARDLDRLADATALHARTESKGVANQKVFSAILDRNLPRDELDELAKKLEGFQVSGTNAWTSTGRLGVTVTKAGNNGARLVRTITARHEKAGWKVVDISGLGKYEKPVTIPGLRGGRGMNRRR